jgi:hypothetical protein
VEEEPSDIPEQDDADRMDMDGQSSQLDLFGFQDDEVSE